MIRPFRAEVYPRTVEGHRRFEFRIIRTRGGKTVATSHLQGYSRRIDAVRTLGELGISEDDIEFVDGPA